MILRFAKSIISIVLSLLCVPTLWAQTPAINLTFESAQGPIEISVGGRIEHEAESNTLYLSGGVQIQQADGSLLLADEAQLITAMDTQDTADPQPTSPPPTSQTAPYIAGLRLKGRIFAKYGTFELHADTMDLGQGLRFFAVMGVPARIQFNDQHPERQQPEGQQPEAQQLGGQQFGGQFLEANEGMIGDIEGQVFYAFGETTLRANTFLLHGDRVQITLPKDQESPPLILAEGGIHLRGQDVLMSADRIESALDGDDLYLSGNIVIDTPTGALEAGSAHFNLTSQAFSLNATTPPLMTGQEFLSL